MIYSLLGLVSSFENYWWGGGGGSAPHHLHLLFCKSVYIVCAFSVLQSRFFCKNLKLVSMSCSVLIKLHLYKRSHKYKKNETFQEYLQYVHRDKLSIQIFQTCHWARAVLFADFCMSYYFSSIKLNAACNRSFYSICKALLIAAISF